MGNGRSTFFGCFILFIAVGTCGCNSGHEQETAQVQGIVKLDGKPLAGGSIMFVPEMGRGAVGHINADGRFVLGTYAASDGAIIGKHKVAVFPVSAAFESEDVEEESMPIPTHYQSGDSSGIEVEVKAGEQNEVEVNLELGN